MQNYESKEIRCAPELQVRWVLQATGAPGWLSTGSERGKHGAEGCGGWRQDGSGCLLLHVTTSCTFTGKLSLLLLP